ncbi:hypothetical protein FRC10_004197 [Ceratobasidium sp. 414]|nr:hypothetical protein FRC10_004197 [Ceratobasidium sp. 414]
MQVYKERQRLFAPGEFLLADGGYPVSPYVVIPFARNELNIDGARRRDFNHKMSKARIVVEWAFGRLKARFPSLKKLGAVHDINDIYRAIEAMMVLHNMCQELGDVPSDSRARHDDDDIHSEADGDLDEDDEQVEMANEDMNVLRAGRVFRQRCVDLICPP